MKATADIAARREALTAQHPAWPGLTLCGAFDAAAARYPDRPMFSNEQGRWTYREMQVWSRRLASGLIAWGVAPGEHVALLMANYAEFVALKLAIARARAVTIPINYNLRGDELRYVVDQSDSVLLITVNGFRGRDYLADLFDVRAEEPRSANKLREVFARSAEGGAVSGARDIDALAMLGDAIDAATLAACEAAANPHDTCDILYTSGTTGRPKGVMLSHDMVLRTAYSSAVHRAFEDGRTILHALPMYHVFGYVECLVASWYAGGHVVSQLVFEPTDFLDLAKRHRASDLICLPNMTMKLLDVAAVRGFDPDSLICVYNSGGVNPPTIWRAIRERLKPAEIHTGYGMSETTASTMCTLPEDDEDRCLTSNGRYKIAHIAGDPATGGWTAEYRVIDPDTGSVLPFGATGELVVRGPGVTKGYYRKPDETAAAFTDGWLHTGDLGRVTEDGYLTLTARLKESYRCGGEMVMPREIEALFDGHPEVELALVVGVPDPRMGDVGCLCIVRRDQARPDPKDLIALVAGKLARFKVPRHVLVFEAADVPMTSTGRPQKIKLAAMAAERLATLRRPISARE